MQRLLLSMFAAALLIPGANAQEGRYTGSGEGDLTVELTHRQDNIYAVSIETVVPIEDDMPGCAGGISGEMALSKKGGNFFVENEDYQPDSDSPMFGERYCEIRFSYDTDGFLNIEEQAGCISYHGGSCGFTGQLSLEDAAN